MIGRIVSSHGHWPCGSFSNIMILVIFHTKNSVLLLNVGPTNFRNVSENCLKTVRNVSVAENCLKTVRNLSVAKNCLKCVRYVSENYQIQNYVRNMSVKNWKCLGNVSELIV